MSIQNGVYKFYIKNYLSSDNFYNQFETIMFEIPSSETSDRFMIDPKASIEMGKAGSFEFKMEMGHPFYNSMLQMKTIIRIEYFGVTLFRGRVLTIDNTMYGTRTVHCEGDLAFMLDTMMEAVRDELKVKKNLDAWLREVINHHNEWVESDKQFTLGNVPGNYSNNILKEQRINNDTRKYDQDSWATNGQCSVDVALTASSNASW